MAIFDDSNITLTREDIKSVSEAIVTAFYEKPGVTEFHTLVSGIEHDKQIVILNIFEGLTGKALTGCAPTPNDTTVGASEKVWQPKRIGDRFTQCYTDLLESFWKFSLKPGVEAADLTSTDFASYIEMVISDAIAEAVYRHAWFGDQDAANYNSSPAGHIKNGTTLAYFNVIDGFWVQIYNIVAADSDRKSLWITPSTNVSLATKNAQSTFALQKFDAADTTAQLVTNTLQTVIDEADERLTAGNETPIFIVTKSVADQYKRERKAFANIDMAYERIENGIMLLKCDGFDLYVFSFWDRIIKAYENNGTKWYLPHRIVFTRKSNLQVGTKEVSKLSDFDPFYDKVTQLYYIDYAFNLDAKIPEDTFIQVSY